MAAGHEQSTMRILRLAAYYSINRDDSELRVLACPKCDSPNVEHCKAKVRVTIEGYYGPLIRCLSCKTHFTFYPEDGKREIGKQEAERGMRDGDRDMRPDGKDSHGHGYYIPFTEKPPCIPDSTYERKMWDENTPEEESEAFRKEMDGAITATQIMANLDLIRCIDFETIAKYKPGKKR